MVPYRYSESLGTIFNKNTIEDFRGCDKTALMQAEGDRVIAAIKSGDWIGKPGLRTRFMILSYADLKKFDFYYCFGFPSPLYGNSILLESESVLNVTALDQATTKDTDLSFCAFKWDKEENTFTYKSLSDIISKTDPDASLQDEDLNTFYFAFSDPSTNDKPGWPLRVFIAALLHSW